MIKTLLWQLTLIQFPAFLNQCQLIFVIAVSQASNSTTLFLLSKLKTSDMVVLPELKKRTIGLRVDGRRE